MKQIYMMGLGALLLTGCHKPAQPQAATPAAAPTATMGTTQGTAAAPKGKSGQALFNACGVPSGGKSP